MRMKQSLLVYQKYGHVLLLEPTSLLCAVYLTIFCIVVETLQVFAEAYTQQNKNDYNKERLHHEWRPQNNSPMVANHY